MAHTKNELLKSNVRRSTIGPGHDGGPKPGFFARPGSPGLLVHHDGNVARRADAGQHSDMARAGAPKRLDVVSPHNGMVTQTKAGATALGGDHKSAIDSLTGQVVVPGQDGNQATAHPLVAPPLAKDHDRPLPTTPGTRSRTSDPLGGAEPGVAHALAKLPVTVHPATGEVRPKLDTHQLGKQILDEGAALDVNHYRRRT